MILIISCVFPPEQLVSANLSRDIAYKLAELQKDISVISPKPSRPYGQSFEGKKEEHHGITHFTLNSYIHPKSNFLGRLRESMSFGLACKKFIRDNHTKISKIYANTWPIFAQYFAIKEAKRFNIPVIMHIQDVYPESYLKKAPKYLASSIAKIIMPFERYIMKHATKVVAISDSMKKYLVETRPIDESNTYVVRNWQDDEFLSKEIPISDRHSEKFTFMYAGSVSASAGVDLLIRSFGDLGAKKNCRLIIAGNGSDREYCMKLASGNDHIEFWDAPFEEIPEIQSKADVLLLPLRKGIGKTATPSKFTAYLFAKKPVLASIDEDCDTANNIRKAGCGFVVPPENEFELRSEMEKILKLDSKKLKDIGENGFVFARQFLSRKANLENIVNIITS